MKKITFLIVAMLMTSFAFAQTSKINPKALVSKDGTTIVRPVDIRPVSQSKAVYVSERFDVDPLVWLQQNLHASSNWFAGNPNNNPFSNVDATNVYSALKSYINQNCNEIIYSPVFDATGSTNLKLSFYVGYSGPWMIGGDEAGSLGADVRAVISTDGGANWIQLWSYADTHNGNESWAWELVEIDLQTTYGGNSNLIIGFQYFGNDGDLAAIDNVLVEDFVAPTVPDFSVVASAQQSMTPLAHATYALSAKVKNTGANLVAPSTLNISVSPGSYTDVVTIPVPFVTGQDSVFTSTNLFVADAVGTHTATFVATLDDDPTPENNTSSTSFEVTELTFGTDNGVITVGGGNNDGSLTFGNVYFLLSDDVVNSYTIGWPEEIDANLDFTVSIYSINPVTMELTQVYTSGTFTRTVAMSGTYAEFDIENQALPAGLYFFAVNQLTATNLSVGCDGAAGGVIYIKDGTSLVNTGVLGNVAIRINMNTAEDGPHHISHIPASNSTGIAVDATVSATFDVNITEVDLTGITITPNPGNVSASIAGDVLTIAHDDFVNNTQYTVLIPAGAVSDGTDNLASNVQWSFTTVGSVGIDVNEVAAISVYPNPANNVITVANAENKDILVLNILGEVVAAISNATSNQTINISKLSAGTYFVKVNFEVFKINVIK